MKKTNTGKKKSNFVANDTKRHGEEEEEQGLEGWWDATFFLWEKDQKKV